MRPMRSIAAVVLLLAPALAGASVRIVPVGGPGLREWATAACAQPASVDCALALDALAVVVTRALESAARHPEAQILPLALLAADAAAPEVRVAAAAALGTPLATPEATAVLAELLDDPVPAVRAAALRSLRSSGDERARRLVRRAAAASRHATPDEAEEAAPETAPGAASMGVPLPADAVYLYFASAPRAGRFTWSTAEPPAKVLAALAAKGKGPLTAAQFEAQAKGGEREAKGAGGMPSAAEMERAMAMAEQMMQAMAGLEGKSPEEQAAAMQRASLGLAAYDENLVNDYTNAELFGDPRYVIVRLASGGEAVVAVYTDLAVGRTGLTVHRAPPAGP